MDDILTVPDNAPITRPLDTAVLERILDFGDAEMRAALCAQLQTDFLRLRDALGGEDGSAVARTAHELKGLAATVGASRVATMARSLDSVADSLAPAARAAMVIPLQREVDAVLDALSRVNGSAAAQ
ncbi:MAG: Hpt domain-containing protein [Rhodobacter sp.]|nr:Hpt domain-containing protein [Paracoccaceae bacterium]MCC0077992.1 Hpt domain-containing protein [Rhodobacter sp.]